VMGAGCSEPNQGEARKPLDESHGSMRPDGHRDGGNADLTPAAGRKTEIVIIDYRVQSPRIAGR
jgi:hypothetical protein